MQLSHHVFENRKRRARPPHGCSRPACVHLMEGMPLPPVQEQHKSSIQAVNPFFVYSTSRAHCFWSGPCRLVWIEPYKMLAATNSMNGGCFLSSREMSHSQKIRSSAGHACLISRLSGPTMLCNRPITTAFRSKIDVSLLASAVTLLL